LAPKAGDDAAKVKWNSVNDLPPLAFDHNTIIETALQRLRMKTRWQPVGINLLPETFTLRDLQDVYEIILGKKLDARNFRSKVLRFGVLTPTGVKQGNHRPAMLWRFDRENYEALLEQGMDFGI
jgi:8-oxo-dGTP diphosphatase